MTPQEKAVIEAARAVVNAHMDRPEALQAVGLEFQGSIHILADVVRSLDLAPAEQEIPWSQVVEGDQLKGKNGRFYEVRSVRPGVLNRKGEIRINLLGTDGNDFTIYRKPDATPLAIVRRGVTGQAVDVWLDVLSSGGTK